MTELEIKIRKIQESDYQNIINISIESFPEEDAEELVKSLFDND